jgi:hypothetical protein
MRQISNILKVKVFLLTLSTTTSTTLVSAQPRDTLPPLLGQQVNLAENDNRTNPSPALDDQPDPIEQFQQQSYIGIGPAFGLAGTSSSLSTGGLAILYKNTFSENFSLQGTSVVFGSSIPYASAALTINFPIRDEDSGYIEFSPFLGGGVAARNENGSVYISPHLTGGVDFPLPIGVTGTIHLDAAFPESRPAEIGIIMGIGSNF